MLAPTVITASNPLDGGLRDLQAKEVETPAAVLQVIDDLDAHCVLSHPVKPMRADPL
jgi:hypothetical protein